MSEWLRRFLRVFFFMTYCLALALPVYSQTAATATTSLLYPPYHDLPTVEGYFPGADNVRLFYRMVGKGKKTIVFLHGGPGMGIEDGALDLEAVAASGFRFIELNERGGGHSELVSDKSKLGIDYYVRDLEALRRYFKLRKMNLVGLSWGAAIVALYASEHPRNINRIVFLSPMATNKKLDDQRDEYLHSLLTKEERAAERAACGRIPAAGDADVSDVCHRCFAFSDKLYVADTAHLSRARGDLCGYTPQAIRNGFMVGDVSFESLGDWDFRPQLAKIRVPALIIEGAKTNVPLEATELWAKLLPNSRLLLIPDAGHQNWLDQPEAVVSAIGDFFQGKRERDTKRLYEPAKSGK
jgi:proline iminopeptidase